MINKIPTLQTLGGQYLKRLTPELINKLLEYQKPIELVDDVVINWDIRKGYNSKVILKDNRTLNIQFLTPGDYGTIEFIQDSTGSRTITLPSISKVSGSGSGAFTLTTTADAVDIASFYYNGTTLYWNLSTDFT